MLSWSSRRAASCVWSLALLCALSRSAALAQAGEAETAEELFARGKQLLAAGDYAQACELLSESYRLDPASGSLFALAVCHERAGKLASASGEYREVARRSLAEGRADRETAARKKNAELEGKLSTLTIDVGQLADARTVEVRMDGALLTPDQLGKPLVLDGGVRLVEVSAEAMEPWRSNVTLANRGAAIVLKIPALEPSIPFLYPVVSPVSTRAVLAVEPAPAPAPPRREAPTERSFVEWTGIGLMAAGAASMTLAIGFTARAIHEGNAAKAECEAADCPSAAPERSNSNRAMNGATASMIAGLGLSAGGLITYLSGRRHRPRSRAAAATAATAWAAPGAFGAVLRGSFR